MEVDTSHHTFHHHQHTDNENTQTKSQKSQKLSYGGQVSVPVPKDLSELCQMLHQVFDSDSVNVDYVSQLMENYKSNPKDWRQYAKYDPHKYTRNLIDEGNGKFNILLLCWAESQGSSIHDHSNSHCFMKCLDGELLETKYEWPNKTELNSNENGENENVSERPEGMVEKSKTLLIENSVCYINGN